jgi:VWFA-related protein
VNRVYLISTLRDPNLRSNFKKGPWAYSPEEWIIVFIDVRLGCLVLVILLHTAAAPAQQPDRPTQPSNGKIHLDVVVAPKSGPPVSGLQQQDFTLLDNKIPQTITSFQAVTGREAPIEVILVIDAVNATAQNLNYERIEIDKFLRSEGGHLAYPIALAVFTDRGIQIVANFSSDGNALSAALQKEDIGLRTFGRSAGLSGEAERWKLSLAALRQLVASEALRSGRKVILWVSPGWPLLSGSSTDLDSNQQKQVFADIVNLSTRLLQARVTLYGVDPLGAGESMMRISYYRDFLKGISKPGQASLGDLSLPVLAIQSGGLALNSTNNIAGLLQECVADAAPYYEISFDSAPAERRDEYHHLEVKIAKPGLTARTRQGYYAQPLLRD